MNFSSVLEKIPKPGNVSLPNVSLPSSLPFVGGNKSEDLGRTPANMTQEDMQSLIDTLQQSVLAPEDDHWNNEYERIVMLTERSFYIIKFDFVNRIAKEIKRVGMGQLVNVVTGPLVYPSKSVMPMRSSPGVQINWGDTNDVSVTQKWNPLCKNLPYAVFTHHPLLIKLDQLPQGQTQLNGLGFNPETSQGALYDVNNFLNALKDVCTGQNISFNNGEITIESYGNIGSVVFNQTNFGFSKDPKKNQAATQ